MGEEKEVGEEDAALLGMVPPWYHAILSSPKEPSEQITARGRARDKATQSHIYLNM